MTDCFEAMTRENRMHPADRIRLMNQHNVNLHASEEGDEYLDSDDEEQRVDMQEIEMEEFIERYVD
jgi:hypothetical protein